MLKLLSFTILWYILWRRNEDNLRVRDNNCTRYFNPRSPCGERLRCSFQLLQAFSISIHAPRAGSDKQDVRGWARSVISIHAPRAGSDRLLSYDLFALGHFNPRSPCGERPDTPTRSPAFSAFQSTLPVRGATLPHLRMAAVITISIHAPRAGSDLGWAGCAGRWALFQSTLPVRGATESRCRTLR